MQLLQVEVGGIQRYIFEGARLREWRGASALLDKAERVEIPSAIAKYGDAVRLLRQGGGVVVLEVGSDGPPPEEVSRTVKRCYERTAPGAPVYSSHALLDPAGVQASLSALTFRTTGARDRAPQADEDLALLGPMMRPCGSCGARPAVDTSEIADDGTLLCSVCRAKAIHGRRVRSEQTAGSVLERFAQHVGENAPASAGFSPEVLENRVPEDLNDIAEAGSGSIALVQADGNSLGKTVQQVGSREEYRALSAGIASAVETAVFDTLAQHPPDGGPLPWEIIFLGGDDVLIATTADRALDVAVGLTRRVEENTEALFQKAPLGEAVDRSFLSMGVGIVAADPHVPMAVLRQMAHDLERSAKDRTYAIQETDPGREVSTVDFHRLTGSGSASLSYVRSHALRPRRRAGFSEVALTQRPFTLGELESVMGVAEAWKEADLPNNKLHALRESLFTSPAEAMQQWTHVVARASSENRTAWHRLHALVESGRSAETDRLDNADRQMPFQVWTEEEPGGGPDAGSRRAATPLLDVIDAYALLN